MENSDVAMPSTSGLPAVGDSFLGTVTDNEWFTVPWSERKVMGVVGQVRMMTTETAIGFETTGGGHANWLVTVTGPTGTVLVIPGCKVHNVSVGRPPGLSGDYLEVP